MDWVALALGVLQIPLLLVGAVYINDLSYGLLPTVVGFGVLAAFVPLWFYTQYENGKTKTKKEQSEVSAEPT